METQHQQLEQWRDALEQILAYYVDFTTMVLKMELLMIW
ncbi:MAG: hypothetical protein RLZZ435_11 [Cyanobacteriota bacterium]|jgi:hypothetical protein